MSEERQEMPDLDGTGAKVELDEKECTIATQGILSVIAILLLICVRAIFSN